MKIERKIEKVYPATDNISRAYWWLSIHDLISKMLININKRRK
jgi:hypothetical protein